MSVTWDDMVKECPELGTMRDEARKVDGSDPHFCANDVWYEQFKPRLLSMVGFEALPSVPNWMTTSRAYEIAYSTIYNELPDCRQCGCL